ncbi:MAG: 50S ribosomal protein L11 methyltransferase [Gammaproteobacteria bacterium]
MCLVQLSFTVSSAEAEDMAALLEQAGASAVTFQPASNDLLVADTGAGLWRHTELTALLDGPASVDAALLRIAQGVAPDPLPAYRLSPLEAKDWIDECRAFFPPLRFGGRLSVHASWCAAPVADDSAIIIDPGLAFGTGHHATTSLCLEWIAARAPLADATVIDYGCGSGILAIAAAKLGARQVWAVDSDATAREVARANLQTNGVQKQVSVKSPTDLGEAVADVLIANILLQPLVDLAPRFASLVVPGGQAVLSGILSGQLDPCVAAYRPWFEIGAVERLEEWALVPASRLTGSITPVR